ncbi:DUF871 domain-containing protein [Paenibacillus hemerocallicola]|uniref:DUF871 domain-containing protein n=1 Tax=Paenibacillus hemerocallicola TaxID=1172614 RepID=A0A5C4TGB0_9BACL|nr:MupG family TIM beta-alpha barrel fold protein [Paenibacillus hemerocallicola]TNJ67607.1 DUF871 domain-containing protein [Paenibacillus hemerocallicola]
MTELGRSFYPTLGLSAARRHLDDAIRAGCKHLFTSLHIPEAEVEDWAEVRRLLEIAAGAGISVAADVSRASLSMFGAAPDDLSPIAGLGIGTLRLDHGFTMEETLHMLRSPGFSFQINAGSTTPGDLLEMENNGIERERLIAVHNFYPRRETGVSLSFYRMQNRMFKERGIRTAGFIPAHGEPRAPLYAGLPTVEAHRHMTSALAAAELMAEQLTDIVYYGDPAPDEYAWMAAGLIAGGTIPLRVAWTETPPEELMPLLSETHTSPWDGAEQVIRSARGRKYMLERGIAPAPSNTDARPAGTVTMDNALYTRYAGELQVARIDLPADERVNVLGRVVPEDRGLLRFIGPRTAFRFV